MKLHELFQHDVTRDIPPVVYFHEQSPAKLASEVSEYIITGGYADGDPRARRVKNGIHEELVHLLRSIRQELKKPTGPELPASWISGFYGSGKSSFAKLLGLALDGVALPDGTPLGQALLARDDSPRRQELADAWQALVQPLNPIAVVFDIGGVARDNEHIHSAVLRQIQARLGYCAKSNLVAEHELKLERDEQWPAFLAAGQQLLGRPWSEAKDDEQAEDHFSHVLHVMMPERYLTPTDWIDSRAGARTGAGTSVREVVAAIEAMLSVRGENKTLFIVVDEVSQYVHQDEARMLKLQSFVSDLGQQLKGLVWLLATGQQKLEDQAQAQVLGKLKDRFPPQLRVHLATTNIRDVVHKRLLKKRADKEGLLRETFRRHSSDLRLYGYGCADITEEDFVEVYPMVPGHIDLLMQITSSLRTRSTRIQGDDHAIRGLLQLLGELFREQKLAEQELGALITLDAIFEVQHSALDADVQTTLARIFAHADVSEDTLAQRVAKAVSLLELIQEQTPTTPELVAQCLYARLGEGSRLPAITAALEKLRDLSLLSYSEKHGYKVQSSAGQEWQREREDIGITQEHISTTVQDALKGLVGALQERPRWRNRTFPWSLRYSDGRQAHDEKLQDARDDSAVTVDFRFLGRKDDRTAATWVQKSAEDSLRNRLVWLVGESAVIEGHARELARSERMVERYRARRESLSREKLRLLIDEETRLEDLETRVRTAVDEAFLEGSVYFRGQPLRPRSAGASFSTALMGLAVGALPELYPHFIEIAVTPAELGQLLERELTGPSTKFMEGGLGILSLDAGKYVASCQGVSPIRIVQEVQTTGGLTGQALIATFVAPPYGYAPDLVKACVAGLLRGKKLRVRPEQGEMITSHKDPGVRELFIRDRDFRRAELFPAKEGEVSQRDRVAIRRFFETYLQVDVDPEDESIADHTFAQFPGQRERLREVERRFNELPGRPAVPPALEKLVKALEECQRSRSVQRTVVAVKRQLEVLRDGVEQLGLCYAELSEDAVRAVTAAVRVREHEVQQLRQLEALGGIEADVEALTSELSTDRPWRGLAAIEPSLGRIRDRYREIRKRLLNTQSAEAEAALARLKTRAGFELLTADESHHVLRPLAEALVDTTAEAVAPTLAELRAHFASRIGGAEEQANERLDQAISDKGKKPVVKVDPRLRGREIGSREQLHALFRELEERIGPQLDKGVRVRLG